MSQPWFEDGLDESEFLVVHHLREMALEDEAAALRVLGMPFLSTVESVDASAVDALRHLLREAPERFLRVVTHPSLSGGITDSWVHVIVVLSASDFNPELVDNLLDLSKVNVETRLIDLPLAGNIEMAIVRTRPGSRLSMDMLEQSVRRAEEFMRTPLPIGHVTLLFEDNLGGWGGLNLATYIAIVTSQDEDANALHVLSHEVAHYYWRGDRGWLDEGAATLMSRFLKDDPPARWAEPLSFPYYVTANIAELERLRDEGTDRPIIHSYYVLGSRLFSDLYRTLGDDAFRDGFRNLYMLSEDVRAGIEEVKTAFKEEVPDKAPVIDTIAARWYDNSEPYDLSHLDTALVDPDLREWNGKLDKAYIIATDGGPPVDKIVAHEMTRRMWLKLDYSYRDNLAPLQFEIVEAFQDGFVFNRQDVTVTTPPDRTRGTYQLFVGSLMEPGPGVDIPEWWGFFVGRFWIYVYHEGRKVAELTYEVIP